MGSSRSKATRRASVRSARPGAGRSSSERSVRTPMRRPVCAGDHQLGRADGLVWQHRRDAHVLAARESEHAAPGPSPRTTADVAPSTPSPAIECLGHRTVGCRQEGHERRRIDRDRVEQIQTACRSVDSSPSASQERASQVLSWATVVTRPVSCRDRTASSIPPADPAAPRRGTSRAAWGRAPGSAGPSRPPALGVVPPCSATVTTAPTTRPAIAAAPGRTPLRARPSRHPSRRHRREPSHGQSSSRSSSRSPSGRFVSRNRFVSSPTIASRRRARRRRARSMRRRRPATSRGWRRGLPVRTRDRCGDPVARPRAGSRGRRRRRAATSAAPTPSGGATAVASSRAPVNIAGSPAGSRGVRPATRCRGSPLRSPGIIEQGRVGLPRLDRGGSDVQDDRVRRLDRQPETELPVAAPYAVGGEDRDAHGQPDSASGRAARPGRRRRTAATCRRAAGTGTSARPGRTSSRRVRPRDRPGLLPAEHADAHRPTDGRRRGRRGRRAAAPRASTARSS